jgi:hypothetical protein
MTMPDIETDITGLELLTTRELHKRWRRIYHAGPPSGLSRNLLIRAIAYKIQERAHGGLSSQSKRQLRTLAEQLKTAEGDKFKPGIMLKVGAKLVREWGGQTHMVIVREDGFDYGGRSYRSLSMIARKITGTRWSGPRFFGIRRALKPFSSTGMEARNGQV